MPYQKKIVKNLMKVSTKPREDWEQGNVRGLRAMPPPFNVWFFLLNENFELANIYYYFILNIHSKSSL